MIVCSSTLTLVLQSLPAWKPPPRRSAFPVRRRTFYLRARARPESNKAATRQAQPDNRKHQFAKDHYFPPPAPVHTGVQGRTRDTTTEDAGASGQGRPPSNGKNRSSYMPVDTSSQSKALDADDARGRRSLTAEPLMKVRVFVVDDHGILRGGLRALINLQPDMEV